MKSLSFIPVWIAICSSGLGFDYHSVRGRFPVPVETTRIEGESMYLQKPATTQSMAKFGPHWSGNTHAVWKGVVGESMNTVFTIPVTGRYRLAIQFTADEEYGICHIAIDGQTLLEYVDTYNNVLLDMPNHVQLGEIELSKGKHMMKLTLAGGNSKGKPIIKDGKTYLQIGIDYLQTSLIKPIQAKGPIVATPVTGTVVADINTIVEPYTFLEMKTAFSEHCYKCHGAEKKKGKVNLEELTTPEAFLANIELVRKIGDSLEFREMPPEDEPQPADEIHSRMVATVKQWVDQYLESNTKLPVVTMRRMNRYEYSNSVRDLLDLRGDIYPLPEKAIRSDMPYFDPKLGEFPDNLKMGNRPLGKRQVEEAYLTGVTPFAVDLQAEHGFNNRGDELSMSPILMESFLNLANSIVDAPEFPNYSKIWQRIFTVPETTELADQITVGKGRLTDIMTKAYRSPVEPESLNRYLAFFESELNRHSDFTRAMKKTVSGIIASPRFIYIVERQQQDDSLPLDAWELATRLSFFLWSTIPDQPLLDAAESGVLLTEPGLRKQVNRMLESPKSQALSHNFARQWLRLDQLINAIPDYDRFTHYYSRFGCEQFKFGLHAMAEPILLFENIMVEDRSIMLLVDSNYAYRTDSMQTWYGNKGTPFQGKGEDRFQTYQSVYRKTKLNTRREGGIMTTAAMLTMTSDTLRTNPIHRGAWTLGVMFNQPPPPPPDAVPEIEADDAEFEAKGLTLRQRLKQHQENESCASCHSKIDPLGFAFENYDAVGRWRDKYRSGLKIDASGDLFGEHQFTDVVGFKDAMMARPELFMKGFTEHLLSYALGRELALSDQSAVERILKEIKADHGQFSTVVQEVVRSYPFRHKSQHRTSPRH